MRINRYLFQNDNYEISEDIDFSHESLNSSHIRKIGLAKVKVTGKDYDELLVLNISIDADVIGVCAYSLEDVPLRVRINETLSFSYEDEDEDVFHIDEAIFDLNPYILSLIISEVPLKIVKKGAKLPSSGEGYRVLNEDQYNSETKNKKDSRWDKLDDIEL